MQAPNNEIKPWDLIELAYRRRWVIILPLFVSVMVGLILAFVLPKVYKASATILAQPQQVPKDYITTAVPEEDSIIILIAQQILSDGVLERVVSDNNLYKDPEHINLPMQNKVDLLRSNIMIELIEEGMYSKAYTVSFNGENGEDSKTVTDVTNSLIKYFFAANTKGRESNAIGTTSFLSEELENTRKRLGEMEADLKDYRQQYMGELPEQLDSNLKTLERLQDQLNGKEDTLRSLRLSLSETDKQIEEERYSLTVDALSGKGGSSILEVDTTDLGLLKEQLANLQTRYTEQHPDIKRLKAKIAQLEAEKGTEKGRSTVADRSSFGTTKTRYVEQIQRRRATLQNEKTGVEMDIAGLKNEIADYQKRVENTPKREQEYIILKRDYDNLSGSYESLLKRKLEAEMAVSLEKQQKGEQFQVLDKTRVKIVKPNLRIMIVLSIALGLGLGAGLVVLLENMRNTFSGPEEIESELKLPVIATIPRVLTKRDIFMKRTELTLCSLAVFMTVTGICAFAYVTFTGTEQAIETVRQVLSL